MDQNTETAYERYVRERAAERARKQGKSDRDDVDRCTAVYRPNGRDDDGEPEFF